MLIEAVTPVNTIIQWEGHTAIMAASQPMDCLAIYDAVVADKGYVSLTPNVNDAMTNKKVVENILKLIDAGAEVECVVTQTAYENQHCGGGIIFKMIPKDGGGSAQAYVVFIHVQPKCTSVKLPRHFELLYLLANAGEVAVGIGHMTAQYKKLLRSEFFPVKPTVPETTTTQPTNHNLVMKGVSQRGTNYVLYHADSDGRFAGYAASKFLGGLDVDTKYLEVQYGKPFPVPYDQLTRNDTVTILDFSYVRDVMIELSKYVGHIAVLDHHEKAEEQLRNIGIDLKCPSYIVFDLKKSGALLAYEHYYADRPVPRGLALINDRDLWTKQFEDSPHLESYLRNELVSNGQGHTWAGWETIWDIMPDGTNAFVEKGKLYGAQEQRTLDKFFKSKRHSFLKITGRKVLIYNCPGYLHSEIAERYYNAFAVDYTLGWRVIENGKQVLFNLRSNNGTNVADIAVGIKDLPGGISGGGHAAAAGATMHITEGMLVILEFLDAAVSKLEDLNDSQD